jgi:small-conductance mechanosensitive channel
MDIGASLSWLSEQFNKYLPKGTPLYVGELIASILIFILFLVVGLIVYHVFEHYFSKWAKKTKTKLDDEILKNVKRPVYVLVLFFGIFFALTNLTLLKDYSDFIAIIFVFFEILLIAFIITRVFNVFIAWYADRQAKKRAMSEHILYVFKMIINAIVYTIALLVILSILQIDLSGVVLSLGVMGIVIGLALQNVLSDVFSAFSIYFDRPFEIGDFIVIGDYSGTVKKIGMKSTRVKLLQGEELILSNRELTTASVRNFKKMNKRRISFSFGVTYDTSTAKLKKIPDIIRTIIDSEKIANIHKLDRVHFTEFGNFSLIFDVVYFLNTKDYNKYKDTQQEINFKIKEAFEKEGIEMAFPTQTIYLNK